MPVSGSQVANQCCALRAFERWHRLEWLGVLLSPFAYCQRWMKRTPTSPEGLAPLTRNIAVGWLVSEFPSLSAPSARWWRGSAIRHALGRRRLRRRAYRLRSRGAASPIIQAGSRGSAKAPSIVERRESRLRATARLRHRSARYRRGRFCHQ